MSEELEKKEKKQDDSFDLVGLLYEYLAQWKWFVLCIAIAVAVGYYLIATIVPTYEVTASIYLSDENVAGSSTAIALSKDNPMINTKNYIDETEIEILRSRNNLIKIVDSLNLAYSYYNIGTVRDIPLYGTNAIVAQLDSLSLRGLSSPITVLVEKNGETFNFDITTTFGGVDEQKIVKTDTLPVVVELSQGTLTLSASEITNQLDEQLKIVISNPSSVAAALAANLTIEFAKNSSTILRITCATPIIQQGKDVINALLAFYNQDIIADKNRSAEQTEAFISERLKVISGEVEDVEQRLQQYRQENNISDQAAQTQMSLSQQSATAGEIADIDAQLAILSSLETQVAHQDEFQIIPAFVSNAELNALIEAYNNEVNLLSRSLNMGTEDNPAVRQRKTQLNQSKSRILQSIRAVKNSLYAERDAVVRMENLSANRLASTPAVDKGLQEIYREQEVKNSIYTYLLQKQIEVAMQKTLATPTARLIDNPAGSGPVSPRKMTIYGVSALIGFMIPALLIFLRRAFFPIFKDKEDLERVTKVPVLGEICVAEKGSKMVVGENVSTPIAEMFRLLRNNIQFALTENEKKVILVASSLSGEGKTFVASNIALTFALTGKKTIVLGMDIRRPVLAHHFGLTNEMGVTSFLSGQVNDLSAIISPSGVNDNLFVIPGGPVPPNPNELLLGERMKRMFDALRSEYDCIIIDSAPIGVVSDSFLIAPHADLEIYVARANYSTKRCLNVLHSAVSTGRLPNCYLVLNYVNVRSGSYVYRRYGHYGRYGKGYGYGYGYGYTEERKKKSIFKRIFRRK